MLMKRYFGALIILAILAMDSCTRADLSPSVRIYRPITLTSTTILPVSATAAALQISLITTETDLNAIAYDSQTGTTLSATVSHGLGTGALYRWFLNGAILENQTSQTAELQVLQAGTYELAVELSSGGFKYVQQLEFRIQ